jgi:hypothetical protein
VMFAVDMFSADDLEIKYSASPSRMLIFDA